MNRKVPTEEFFATHPVFSLDEATRALTPPGGKAGAAERLRYHVEAGRLMRVARAVYAVVPHGVESARFHPDPFLVAATIGPDGIFSHHSALELLGAAHSTWNQVTLYRDGRRPTLALNGVTLRFLDHPRPLSSAEERGFATRKVERRGRLLRTTGPERTLVEGFRRPDLVGGLEELVVSATGFPVLDLDVLEEVLSRYAMRKLWAASGWFLERFQGTFHVPDACLERLERFRPSSPRYLLRDDRGGALVHRWNLILPEQLTRMSEPDER